MILLADKNGSTDGVAYSLIQKIKTELPIILVSRIEDFKFNDNILNLVGKKYVLVCYCEYGWEWNRSETHIWGSNTNKFKDIFGGDEWLKFDDFIRDNPPALFFKRELLKKDVTNTVVPIEYPNWQSSYPAQTKEEFNNRSVSVFNYWGRSHEARLMFHGEVWKHSARKGYAVCDNIYFINAFMNEEKNPNKWISLWMPHYSRVDISEILKINAISKLSVSLPGSGIKCFRSTGESIVNSVIVMPEDELAYSHEFINGVNCIKFPIESINGIDKEWHITTTIENALKKENLYDIYLEGLKAADFYRVENYISRIEKQINQSIYLDL